MMHVLFKFSRQIGPKHADCEDSKGLSRWHLFAHKRFRVVGIPVLGAVTLQVRQFVLEGGAAGLGLTCAWATGTYRFIATVLHRLG
jgi:hypothetical protein